MKRSVTVASIFLAALSSQVGSAAETLSLGFVAPLVSNTSEVKSPEYGEMVFDGSSGSYGALKVYNKNNAWVLVDATSGGSVTSSGTEKIERARISAPSGGSCTVTSTSGSWISGTVTSSATGKCALTITGAFGAAPTCVVTGVTAGYGASTIGAPTIDTVETYVYDSASGNPANEPVMIICMGLAP